MLNLSDPVVYTDEEKTLIDELHMNNPGETGTRLWAKNTIGLKGIKGRISRYMLEAQKCRCAYCESILQEGGAEIDHIAPKTSHPKFVYESLNLVMACGVCNSKVKKGDKETMDEPFRDNYTDNTFLIVHPYLDNADEEIRFVDPMRVFFNKKRCSVKGLETIRFFRWDSVNSRESRWRNARLFPISKKKMQQMVLEISTYK